MCGCFVVQDCLAVSECLSSQLQRMSCTVLSSEAAASLPEMLPLLTQLRSCNVRLRCKDAASPMQPLVWPAVTELDLLACAGWLPSLQAPKLNVFGAYGSFDADIVRSKARDRELASLFGSRSSSPFLRQPELSCRMTITPALAAICVKLRTSRDVAVEHKPADAAAVTRFLMRSLTVMGLKEGRRCG
jgi:hypothetical protein